LLQRVRDQAAALAVDLVGIRSAIADTLTVVGRNTPEHH
jgi:hypothetical protein